MIILQPSDKFEIKCDGAVFTVSPYTKAQELELEKCVSINAGEEVIDIREQQRLVFKFCIKAIEGVKKASGEEFVFRFDDNGCLCDEHADLMIMNISSSKVYLGLLSLRQGKTGTITTHDGGEPDMELNYLGN